MTIPWWHKVDIHTISIPLELEELEEFCIMPTIYALSIKLDSRIPKGLKRIKVPKMCHLYYTDVSKSCEIVRI
jgi:hypothetical protein